MSRVIDKAWGREEVWAETTRYTGKLLKFDAGAQASEHYHKRKDETWLVLSGLFEVELSFEDSSYRETLDLAPGVTLRLPPLTIHRLRCLEAGTIVEVSTPHDDGDVHRLSVSVGAGG